MPAANPTPAYLGHPTVNVRIVAATPTAAPAPGESNLAFNTTASTGGLWVYNYATGAWVRVTTNP